MKDFIHKSLLNAGSKDAVSNMLQGAALGAGANTALGAVQGDFDIVGNATSGALLGAGGGAAMRHMGDKYASAIANMRKQGIEGSDSFSVNHFTHAIKEEGNFWGDPDLMKRAQGLAPSTGTPAAASTQNAQAGKVSSKDGSVNRPGAEGHRDQPIAPTHIEVPSMPSFDRMGMPMSSGSVKVPVTPNTENIGEAIGRAGHRKGGGFTPMNAEQAKAAQMEKDALDAKKANRDALKATFNRNKVKEQSIDRRQQRVMDKQIDSDIKSVNGDLSKMGNMPYTPNEIAKGYQRSGKDANQWAQDTVAKQTQTAKDAQSAAGDIIAGVFRETGRGPVKKPTTGFADGAGTLSLPKGKIDSSKDAQVAAGDLIAGIFKETGRGPIKKPTTGFADGAGTLGMGKKPIDSSNFKPSYRNGKYVHPQHNKVKKYQQRNKK